MLYRKFELIPIKIVFFTNFKKLIEFNTVNVMQYLPLPEQSLQQPPV